ncbi:MAG: hypothetical protein MUD01_05815 [Chloroflexaceae bacterium]|jgi:hypothetical protein|nr:hypothetical protein [Chloroflexaceae bacterium]
MEHLEIARQLDSRRLQLVEQLTVEAMQNPFWKERFGEAVREKIAFDNDHNLSTLVKAVRYRSPMILDDYALWLRKTLVEMRCSSGQVRETFAHMWAIVAQHMPAESHPVLYDYIQSALAALAYPNANLQKICAQQNELAEDLVTDTYNASWHWQAAYSQEGRERAVYDAWYLVDYAIDALGTSNNDILGRHVRWLRDHNIRRGLSTMHMQQLLWLLAEVGRRRLPPGPASDLQRVLEAGSGFLAYDKESSVALYHAQEQIVGDVVNTLLQAGLAHAPEQAAMDVGWYLGYVADGLATNDAAALVGYTTWMQLWYANQGVSDQPIRQTYAALTNAFHRYLPEFAAREAEAMLQAAQRVL